MDLTKYLPPDPSAPVVLDIAKCRKLIEQSERWERQPLGEVIKEMAGQMKLLLNEVGGAQAKVTSAQADATRYQREAEAVTHEVTQLRIEVVSLKGKLEAAVKEIATLQQPATTAAPVQATASASNPARRGRKSKVVQMPQPEPKAAP